MIPKYFIKLINSERSSMNSFTPSEKAVITDNLITMCINLSVQMEATNRDDQRAHERKFAEDNFGVKYVLAEDGVMEAHFQSQTDVDMCYYAQRKAWKTHSHNTTNETREYARIAHRLSRLDSTDKDWNDVLDEMDKATLKEFCSK